MEEIAEAVNGENASPAANDSYLKTKTLSKRPPSRQRFEEEVNKIKLHIESKEQLVHFLLGNGKDSPQTKLQQLREGRDAANQRRRSINTQLEVISQQINSKRDAASQLRSKLQYQTEEQIEEVVRRLEAQLQQHSFRLSEERRLVAEIDKLRRSKKAVKQYNDSKDELTQLRDSQQTLRFERDALSKELGGLRAKEDAFHLDIRKNRDTADMLKKELDELYESRRSRVAEFKLEQTQFLQCREQRRTELSRQRSQEKQVLAQARALDREEVRCSIEPYQEERQLCETLLSFLTKLEGPTPGAIPSTPASCASSIANTPMSPDDARSRLPGFKEELEEGLDSLFIGVPRKSSRKAKRTSSRTGGHKKRLVALTPDLLVQFAALDLTAPTTMADVPSVTEALKAKQKLYTCMAAAELRQRNSNGCAAVEATAPTSLGSQRSSHKPESLRLDLAHVDMSSQGHTLHLNCSEDFPSSLPNKVLVDSTDL